MYSNNIVNFQESITISNACTKKSGNLLNAPRICAIDGTLTATTKMDPTEPGCNDNEKVNSTLLRVEASSLNAI